MARALPLAVPGSDLGPADKTRYSRHLLLPEVGEEGQRRMQNSRVLVVGAGGLGSPALLYLAAAGVGTIGVIDHDEIEVSNLQRQVVHREDGVGRRKTDSARDAVLALNSGIDVRIHDVRLDAQNAVDVFSSYDLVIDGTDNFATRYLVNDAAALAGIPYVWGSIFRFSGQVSVFWAGHGPTYRDLFPEPPPPGMVPSCAEGGVLGVLPAIIGSIMSAEALKLLLGIGDSLLGRVLVVDALSMTFDSFPIDPDPAAPIITELDDYEALCGLTATREFDADASAITVEELAQWIDERARGERQFILVDVRSPGEREISSIPGSVAIPVARFTSGAPLPELSDDLPVVLHCKAGTRSAACLEALHTYYHRSDAVHVAGGIDAWIERIDPTQARY